MTQFSFAFTSSQSKARRTKEASLRRQLLAVKAVLLWKCSRVHMGRVSNHDISPSKAFLFFPLTALSCLNTVLLQVWSPD